MESYDLWLKETIKENHIANIRKLANDLALLEQGMEKRGYSRKEINEACIQIIKIEDKKITKELNEGFSDIVLGVVQRVAPGAKDYFKRQFLDYILSGMGVPTNSKIGSFIVTAFKNVDFLNIVKYFKTGNCPKIVDLVVNVLSDELVKYVTTELGKGLDSAAAATAEAKKTAAKGGSSAATKTSKPAAAGAGSGASEELSTFKDDLSESLILDLYLINEQAEKESLSKLANIAKGVGLKGLFGNENVSQMAQNFRELTKGNFKGGILQQILMDIIKNDLLPVLKKRISDLICKDMDLTSFNKIVDKTLNRGQGEEKPVQQAATGTGIKQAPVQPRATGDYVTKRTD